MNNLKSHALREFRAAGWTYDNGNFKNEMQKDICEHVLKLLEVFDEGGHTGSTAPYAVNLFKTLAMYKPIAPLTGEDWEWVDVGVESGRTLYQNKRNGKVFKDNNSAWNIDGRVFWEWACDPDIDDGKPFKAYFTSYDSRVTVTFPYREPEEPEYVFRPTEQFPNEVIE